jgi:hypothetical protein
MAPTFSPDGRNVLFTLPRGSHAATPVSREDASFEAFFNSAWDRLFR